MKNTPLFLTVLFITLTYISCKKKEGNLPAPTNYSYDISNVCTATLPAGDTIKYFSTSWIVPSSPSSDSVIYWWSGLDLGALQCVLQWVDGTWSIANWYFLNGKYNEGTSVPVSPGTRLTGIIELVSYTADSFTYKESFVGYPSADATFTRPILATSLIESMEPYTDTYHAFPPDTLIRMTDIDCITTTGTHPPDLVWYIHSPTGLTPDGYPATVIVSQSSSDGEVDFYMK